MSGLKNIIGKSPLIGGNNIEIQQQPSAQNTSGFSKPMLNSGAKSILPSGVQKFKLKKREQFRMDEPDQN